MQENANSSLFRVFAALEHLRGGQVPTQERWKKEEEAIIDNVSITILRN